MKQSIFKQELIKKGKVRTVKGELVVTMNYGTKTVNSTHAVTHDDFTKQVYQHKVESFVEGILWEGELKLDSELMVENAVKLMKERLEGYLKLVANLEPEKSFLGKMAELGFNTKLN